MDALLYVIAYLALALLVGGIARIALPGKDDISLVATLILGAVGMTVGAILAFIVLGEARTGGLITGTVIAILILYTVRRLNGGGLRDPGAS